MTHLKTYILFPFFCLAAALWSSCRTSSESEVPMPPTPPHDRIQSEIFPEGRREELTQVPAEETQEIPKGITLNFDGKTVALEDLLKLSSEAQTLPVKVLAHPSTPYREVEEIMDKLHEMGFLITFEAVE